MGSSPAVEVLLETADRLARTDLPVLITGESGTGKEVLARRIHDESARADGPFAAENCAAIPANLLESEFFGHVRGAFTGASQDYEGIFVRANGGTLFLDEIGDMPLSLQAKLLRVLEERRVRPVGGTTSTAFDVRIVCATHQDLQALVSQGKFREDLYYRLCVASLRIRPLRERRADIAELTRHFLDGLNAENRTQKRLTDGVLAALTAYSWPGNVRELRNQVGRLYHLSEGDAIDERALHLPKSTSHAPRQNGGRLVTAAASLADIERDAILVALEETNGDCTAAAQVLGISRSGIYAKMRKFRIDREEAGRAAS